MPLRFVTLPPPSIPQEGDMAHWWDFTDIDTLFQNTGGSTPVTADADPIHRINDKGSATKELTQPGADSLAPIYDTDIFGDGAGLGDGSGRALTSPTNGAEIAVPWSCAVVFRTADITSTQQVLGQLSNNNLQVLIISSKYTFTNVNGAPLEPLTNMPEDTIVSGICTIRSDNTQEAWFNHESGSRTLTEISSSIGSGGIQLMALNVSGGLDLDGICLEAIVWDVDDTGTLVDDWKAYTAAKYGITWS